VDAQEILGRYGLVSSSWSDWARFKLHRTAPQKKPKLVFPDGKLIRCHGYITGQWTSNDLSQQWGGIRVFVVDAEFGLEGEDERCNFFLNPEIFTDMNPRKRK
jgi:hypothetical protein